MSHFRLIIRGNVTIVSAHHECGGCGRDSRANRAKCLALIVSLLYSAVSFFEFSAKRGEASRVSFAALSLEAVFSLVPTM